MGRFGSPVSQRKHRTLRYSLPKVGVKVEAEQVTHALNEIMRGSDTVMVVDYDDMVRYVSLDFLQMYGYSVLEAKDGEAAIEISEQHGGPIHLMVIDVVMPGITGRKLTEHLKKTRSKMKILYTSGYMDNTFVFHGILGRKMNFIAKPFTYETLGSKVREILNERQTGNA